MAKSEGITYLDIVRDVKDGKFAPIYLLMGDEDYYIDQTSQYILDQALKQEERDFNYDLLYGAETRSSDILSIAQQFPMMADRRVVMVREFQSMRDKDALTAYAKNPNPTTVLILCHKHGKLDGHRNFTSEIKKNGGVVYDSRRPYDRELPPFVTNYIQRRGKTIDSAAVQMICDHVGCDLSRLSAELDKLIMALPNGENRVGVTLVEELTGMNKDFNNYELQNALARRDVYKANQIVKYFDSNPRSFALPVTLISLFNLFSEVLLAYFSPEQTDDGIAQYLGRPTWQARQAIIPARKNYSGQKVINIISEITQTDAKSKGVGGNKSTPGDLLKELIFFILH